MQLWMLISTIMFKHICPSLILFFLFLQAGAQQNISGTVTEEIITKNGTIKITHTKHLPKGTTILGTLTFDAGTSTTKERLKRLKVLGGLAFNLGTGFVLENGVFTATLPGSGTTPLQVFSQDGELINEIILNLSEPVNYPRLDLPQTLLAENIEKITGKFSGYVSQASVCIDGHPVRIIAGNESELYFNTGDIKPGKYEMSLNYNDTEARGDVNVVGYSLHAGKLSLNTGESTYLDVKVVGLEDIGQALEFEIKNMSAGTITLEGGGEQTLIVEPEEVAETGEWTKRFGIRSLKRGRFSVETNLDVISPVDENNVISEEMPGQPESHLESAPIQNTNKGILFNVSNYLDGIPAWEENDENPNFSDETTGPCDTTEVDFHVKSEINLISQTICELSDARLDSLLNAIDEYEKATWERDSLKGMANMANDFKARLGNLKKASLEKYQQQIDQTNNLINNTEECTPGWEDGFYQRYVAPYPNSQQRTQVYQSYISRYQRNFERCADRNQNRLVREQNAQERLFDNSYLGPLGEISNNLIFRLSGAENKASEKKQDLLRELRKTMGILCEVELKWNSLLSYMDRNVICMKCGDAYFNKPPEMQIMDSCMSNLTSKLLNRIGNIRQPLSPEVLQSLANDYFNLDEMEEELNKLDSLDNVFQSLMSGSGIIKMVHPCCERLTELASGFFLYGHQKKPYSDMPSTAKRYGLGNMGMVAVPSDPGSYKNRGYKKEYRDEMRQLNSQANQIQGAVERSLRRLMNGSNSGKNSALHALKDENAIRLHGDVNAVPIHQQSADDLKKLLGDFINRMGACYNQSVQNQRQRSYTQVLHKCFRFKLCLELLDRQYDDFGQQKENALRELQSRLNRLNQQMDNIEDEINLLASRITVLTDRIRNLRESTTVSISTGLNGAVQNLNQQKNELQQKKTGLQNTQSALNRRIGQLQHRLGNLGEEIPPRPVASIEECEGIRQVIRDAADKLRDEEVGLSNEMSENETAAGILGHDTEVAHNEAGSISGRIRDVSNRVRDIEAEQERRRLAEEQRRLFDEKARCLRLLTEYWDSQNGGGGLLDSLAAAYGTFAGAMESVPQGCSEIIDRLNDFNARVADVQGKIERVLTLLNGVAGEPNNEERAAAFQEILDIAGEIGDRVPGFGEMIGFYSDAYEAAIDAIMEISDKKVDAMKPLVDRFRVSSCPQPDWGNKPLGQILNDKWDDFMGSSGAVVIKHRLTPDEQEKLKEYLKQKTTNEILSCCLGKISQQQNR